MKTYSNRPLPRKPILWRDNLYAVFGNHAYQGKSEEGDDIYEADLTISKGTGITAIMDAFTRLQNDKTLDDAVVYGFEIDGAKAVDIDKSYKTAATSDVFTTLPDSGEVKAGEIYNDNGKAIVVEKDCDASTIKQISDDQIISK
jgi:hypothetical protein